MAWLLTGGFKDFCQPIKFFLEREDNSTRKRRQKKQPSLLHILLSEGVYRYQNWALVVTLAVACVTAGRHIMTSCSLLQSPVWRPTAIKIRWYCTLRTGEPRIPESIRVIMIIMWKSWGEATDPWPGGSCIMWGWPRSHRGGQQPCCADVVEGNEFGHMTIRCNVTISRWSIWLLFMVCYACYNVTAMVGRWHGVVTEFNEWELSRASCSSLLNVKHQAAPPPWDAEQLELCKLINWLTAHPDSDSEEYTFIARTQF